MSWKHWERFRQCLFVSRLYMKPFVHASNMHLQWVGDPTGCFTGTGTTMTRFDECVWATNRSSKQQQQPQPADRKLRMCKWRSASFFNISCRIVVTSKQWHHITREWLIRWYIYNWKIVYKRYNIFLPTTWNPKSLFEFWVYNLYPKNNSSFQSRDSQLPQKHPRIWFPPAISQRWSYL